MIFKNLTELCRQNKLIWLYGEPGGVQWVSEGHAMYPLHGMPCLTSDVLARVFDVPEKDRPKYSIRHDTELPELFCYEDVAKNEIQLKDEPYIIQRYDTVLRPVRTSRGLMFYDPNLLKPLRDVQDTMEIYERKTPKGQIYFAVKSGFLLQAIVLPYMMDSKRMLDELLGLCEALQESVEREKEAEAGR